MLRPGDTLEEEYQKTLEEELLLRSIEDRQLCPDCSLAIKSEWIVCPFCESKLKSTCRKCGKSLDLNWKRCPFCGTIAPQPGYDSAVPMKSNEYSKPLSKT